MVDIGITQEQIDAMLAGTSGQSSGVDSHGLSTADAQAFADFERDTMGNFPSVINAMTGFDYRLSSVEVARTHPDEIAALVGEDMVFSIPLTLGAQHASFLVLDVGFAKQVAAALTGAEIDGDLTLSDMELSALGEVISQGRGAYLSSLARALKVEADANGEVKVFPNSNLPVALENGSLVASVMMEDSAGKAAHILHIIPPGLAKMVLDGIHQSQAPVLSPPQQQQHVAVPAAMPSVMSASPQSSGSSATPQGGSGNIVDAGSAQYSAAVFGNLGGPSTQTDVRNLDMLLDVPLQITVELGKTQVPIRQILEYGQGSLITLDKLAGEPIDMLVNGRYFAKAEVVVIDENFGVRITSILSPGERIAQVK
jgi:flagellar motor switch protein FliN/FliY